MTNKGVKHITCTVRIITDVTCGECGLIMGRSVMGFRQHYRTKHKDLGIGGRDVEKIFYTRVLEAKVRDRKRKEEEINNA